MTLTAEKELIQDLDGKRRSIGPSNPKLKKEVKTYVTELYKTRSDMSDSYFTPHETNEFAEEVKCECGADCIVQPLESYDFVLLKSATKK